MTILRLGYFATLVALIVLCPGTARAEPLPGPGIEDDYYDREFSLGVGYARVAFTGAENDLNEIDAIHFNPVMSFAPLPQAPALRLGASVGITFNLEDVSGIISSGGGGLIVVGNADTSLWLFEPELVLSWRQPLGDEDVGFFVEPGITGGGTFAFLDIDDEEFQAAGGEGSADESAGTWHARGFLRAGMRATGGIGGFEIAYLRGGELDFGNDTGGEVEEFYIGIFGALKF